MIRVLIGSALTVLSLGLVADFTGPDLVTGLEGPRMVVSSAGHAAFQHVRFDGEVCAPTLLGNGAKTKETLRPGVRFVAFVLRPDGSDMEVAIREVPGEPGAPTVTVALLYDETGRLVSVHKEPALDAAAAPQACASRDAGPV